jgi:hypothetical protein
MCDNQQVFKTPSTNIAIAMNELNKLSPNPWHLMLSRLI